MVLFRRGRVAPARLCFQLGAVGAMAIALAACTTDGQPTTVGLTASRTGTIAFESIEGPPDPVFRKLVTALGAEAETRQMAFVSREEAAQYRIRGYVSAHVQKKRTTIAWVWDVYDAEQHRALRLSGEQAADGSRTGWAAADDGVLRQIARDGMDRLTTYLVAPAVGPAPAPTPPETPSGVAVSALDQKAGILASYSDARD